MALDFPNSPVLNQLYPSPAVAGVPVWKWDGAEWVIYSGNGAGSLNQFEYQAGTNQTNYSGPDINGATMGYTQNFIWVFVGGIKINKNEFTATDGVNVTLAAAPNAGEYVTILAFSVVSISNTLAPGNNLSDLGNVYAARSNLGLTKKNYILNGGMQVSQENGSTAGTGVGYYPVDQFKMDFSITGTVSAAQVASLTPGGSPNRIRITATAAQASVAAGNYFQLLTLLEGLRVSDLKFGTSSAKSVVLQFGVKAPAGTYCAVIMNAAANRSYVAEYTITPAQANADTVVSLPIPGDTTGVWATDNTGAVYIRWGLMVGSTYQQAAGSWGTVNAIGSANQTNFFATNGNVFELFDVSLTEGTVAPPFQLPDYASELLECLRYFELIPAGIIFGGGTLRTNGNAMYGQATSAVPMRPGMGLLSTSGLAVISGDTITAVTSPGASIVSGNKIQMTGTISAAGTTGASIAFYQQTGKNAFNARM